MLWAEVDTERVCPSIMKKAAVDSPRHLRLRMYYMGLCDPDSG